MNSYDKYLEDEDRYNKRMDVIGRNGNDGDHYEYDFNGATVTVSRNIGSPCVAHSHWSHGFSIGDTVTVNDETFMVKGMSDRMLSLEIYEEVN